MPISKPNFNLVFASQAPEQDKPASFNNYLRGWDESRANNGKPTIKQFNYLQQQADLKTLWVLQNGGALPYDSSIDYAENAIVFKDGELRQKVGAKWVSYKDKILESGVPANAVIDGNGKTQEDINSIALDPNLAPLGWTQKDFNDSVIDVKKFIKKDLSNMTDGFQAAIEEAYGQTLLISIPLAVQDTIYINKGLKIKGNRSSAHIYASDIPLLNFSSLSSGKHGLYVAESNNVIGFSLESVYMVGGNNGGVGLKFGTNIEKNCADYSVDKALIRNFSVGIEQSFSWDGSFSSVRVQGCRDGIKHSNQANAILYSQCAVVSSSNQALNFINAEGVQFDACDISNCTKTDGAPISLYQSTVTFNTPYFENIDNINGVVQVGAESETFGSKLIINSPFKLGKDIIIGGSKAYAEINGHDRDNVGIKGFNLNTLCKSKVTQSQTEKTKKILNGWNAKQNPQFTIYTGSPTVIENRNFITLSSNANAGYNISNTLEIGKLYTLVYSIRKTEKTIEVGIRHPSSSSPLTTDDANSIPLIRYLSFRATNQSLNLTFIGDIELYGFSVIEGNLDNFPSDPFFQSEFGGVVQVVRSKIPIVGLWKIGDTVINSNPTTHVGWVYTSEGWKQYGAIV